MGTLGSTSQANQAQGNHSYTAVEERPMDTLGRYRSSVHLAIEKARIRKMLKTVQSIEIYSHSHNQSNDWVLFDNHKDIGCSSCRSRRLFDRKVLFLYP